MKTFDTERNIIQSEISDKAPSVISSIPKPFFAISYRFQKPEEMVDRGTTLFIVTIGCEIKFRPECIYLFKIRNVTEIINDPQKPIAVWSLKIICNSDVKYFEEAINKDAKEKDIFLAEPLKTSFNENEMESDIKNALSQFFST